MKALAGTGTLVRLMLRRDRWVLAIWILLLGLYPLLMVLAQQSVNATAADRLAYVDSMGSNSGFLMLYGPVYGASIGALGIWAAGDALWLVGLASLLTVIRYTRAEEEAGRRELLGATVAGRQAGLAAALAVTLGANLVLALVATLSLLGRGLPPGGSIALGLSVGAVGWLFAAVAAVAAQLTESASSARDIAVGALGAAWLLRAAGDAGGASSTLSWLSWLSPIGWARRIQSFAGERWWILALDVLVVGVLTAVASSLAARRDVGAGALRPRLGPASAAPGLRSPLALAWRLHRRRLLTWTAGLALVSGVLSASAKSADDLFKSNPAVGRMFELVGGGARPSDIFLSAIMGMFALLTAAYAVSTTLRLRSEESASRLEPVLVTSASRLRWATSHLLFALLGPVVILAAAGLASGLVYGLSLGDVGGQLPRMLVAAIAQLPAVWVLTGVTAALFGLRPRLVWGGWAVLAVFGLIWTVAMSVQLSEWLLNLSPFNHVPRLPGGEITATPLIWLVAGAATLVAVGLGGFRRRDVEAS